LDCFYYVLDTLRHVLKFTYHYPLLVWDLTHK
jgi:hypothetical protein